MKGDHFCLVLSPKSFHQRFKLAMVCPISSGVAPHAREAGFLVSLMGTGMKLNGSIHAHQLKTIDWEARKAKFVEKTPGYIVDQVVDCIFSVLEDE